MAVDHTDSLTGVEKAAVLTVALGIDKATDVLSRLASDEVERLARQIAAMPAVDSGTREAVVAEVIGEHAAGGSAVSAGPGYARALLERVLGPEAAARAAAGAGDLVPGSLDPPRLAAMLREEHPQTIAFVLSQQPTARAAAVFAAFDTDLQTQIAVRMVGLESMPPQVMRELRDTVRERLAGLLDGPRPGGTQALADLLENADRSTERGVLASLEREAPQLAHDVRGRVFTFEDLSDLDARLLQRVIRETPHQDLTLALAGADVDVRQAVLGNVSERQAAAIREDLDTMGAIRLRDVEAAQRRMAARARRLLNGDDAASTMREGWAVA